MKKYARTKSVPGTANGNCKALEAGVCAVCKDQQGSQGGRRRELKEKAVGGEMRQVTEGRAETL